MDVYRLNAVLRLDDKMSKGMTKAMGVVAAATAAIGVASKAFYDFQGAMNKTAAVSGATGSKLEELEQKALEMGRTTKFSATESAEALTFLAMAGLDADASMTALPGTLNLAAAGGMDLATAADIATNVMSGFGAEASDLDGIVDIMATTAANANTNVTQMGDAMVYAGPVASAAGLSMAETAAAIGQLANAGFQGEMGGTALRGSITKLLAPSKEAAGILARLGVTATDSAGQMVPLRDVIGQFAESGITAGEAMTIFGQRAGPGMLALISQGVPAFDELKAKIDGSEGSAAAMAATMQGGVVGAVTRMMSAFDTFKVQVGAQFAPAFEKISGAVTGMLTWLQASEGRIETVGAVLTGVLVGGIAMATAALWTFVPAMTAATGGLNIIIPLVVGGITVAWIKWGDEIKWFLSTIWNAFVDAIDSVMPLLSALGRVIGMDIPERPVVMEDRDGRDDGGRREDDGRGCRVDRGDRRRRRYRLRRPGRGGRGGGGFVGSLQRHAAADALPSAHDECGHQRAQSVVIHEPVGGRESRPRDDAVPTE